MRSVNNTVVIEDMWGGEKVFCKSDIVSLSHEKLFKKKKLFANKHTAEDWYEVQTKYGGYYRISEKEYIELRGEFINEHRR